MNAPRARSVPQPEASLTAAARLAVVYRHSAERLALQQLDRHGLVAILADDAWRPPLGMPCEAQVMAGDVPLCTLRLVARSLARSGDGALALTMQPSRADDDLVFWQALYAHLPGRPAPTSWQTQDPRDDGAAERKPRPHARRFAGRKPAAGRAAVLFELPSPDEAAFFCTWLEYHFAEMKACAHAAVPLAKLLAIDRHLMGTDVEVVFRYCLPGREAQRCTEALAAWALSEVLAHFQLPIRAQVSAAQPTARLRSASPIRIPCPL